MMKRMTRSRVLAVVIALAVVLAGVLALRSVGTSSESPRREAGARLPEGRVADVRISSTLPRQRARHAHLQCAGAHTGYLADGTAQAAACTALLGNDVAREVLEDGDAPSIPDVDCSVEAGPSLKGAEATIRGVMGNGLTAVDFELDVASACDEYLWLALHPLFTPVSWQLLISGNSPFDPCEYARRLDLATGLCG